MHETLEMDDAMRKVVMAEAGGEKYREQARRLGMVTMRAAGLAKVAEGITTIEEVLRVLPGVRP